MLEQAGIGVVHVDVMDGWFTPVMTVGPPFVKALRTPLLKDVHLMIREPLATLADYVAAGADIITVHQESCTHIHRVLQVLGTMTHAADPRAASSAAWRSIPGTPLEAVEPLLSEIDLLLLLAVNPGWGGQKFIAGTFDRMARARALIEASGRRIVLWRGRRRDAGQHGGNRRGRRGADRDGERRLRRQGGGRQRRLHAEGGWQRIATGHRTLRWPRARRG